MIPTLTANSINIQWRAPNDKEYNHRVAARLDLRAEAQVSDFIPKAALFDVKKHTEEILCRTILRKVYPVELIRELRELRDRLALDARDGFKANEICEAFAPIIESLVK